MGNVLQLPQVKTQPSLSAQRMKALLYGAPKVGKTTFCAELDPDHTLFLATEPGQGAHEMFLEPVASWQKFRDVYAALATGEHGFTTIVVDTVDQLFLQCRQATMEELGIAHPSDLEWGKGWDAVATKWRTGLGALASLGLGVWFISHADDVEIKQRIGTITKTVPALKRAGREFVVGFVDYIFFAQVVQTESGKEHLLRTAAQENFEAGGRIGPPMYKRLPDPLPLKGGALLDAVARAIQKEEKQDAHNSGDHQQGVLPGPEDARPETVEPGLGVPIAVAGDDLEPAAADGVPASGDDAEGLGGEAGVDRRKRSVNAPRSRVGTPAGQ